MLQILTETIWKCTGDIVDLAAEFIQVVDDGTATDRFQIHFIGQNDNGDLDFFGRIALCRTKGHTCGRMGEERCEEISTHVPRTQMRDELCVDTMQRLQTRCMIQIEVTDRYRLITMTMDIDEGQQKIDAIRCVDHRQQTKIFLIECDVLCFVRRPAVHVDQRERGTDGWPRQGDGLNRNFIGTTRYQCGDVIIRQNHRCCGGRRWRIERETRCPIVGTELKLSIDIDRGDPTVKFRFFFAN